MSEINPKRVLAIDPTSGGFGFAVVESPATSIDWGVKTIKKRNEATTLKKLAELIRLYRPEALIIEDLKNSRRCRRIQDLVDKIQALAIAERIKSRCISVSRIKKVFQTFGAYTKHEIAQVVAQQLPELAARLPRYRKPWMSEDYRMAIFDAAALALTYFYSLRLRNHKPSEA